jgi:hypothetical protein
LARGDSCGLREVDPDQRLLWLHADHQIRTCGRRPAKVNPVALSQVLVTLVRTGGWSLLVARPAVVLIEVL